MSNVYCTISRLADTTEQIQTSPDAITWTPRSSPIDNYGGTCIGFGFGRFVALGLDSGDGTTWVAIVSSNDGASWTSYSIPQPAHQYRSIVYSPDLSLWLAIGDQGEVITAPAAANVWTLAATLSSVPTNDGWSCVEWGGGIFCVVGSGDSPDNVVQTSPDGTTWTPQTSLVRWWDSVRYHDGLFVAVNSGSPDLSGRNMTSGDGETWTARTSAASNQWLSVDKGAGLWVAISNNSENVQYSSDAVTWSLQSVPGADNSWHILYAGGQFIACKDDPGDGGQTVMTSPDGLTWTFQATAMLNGTRQVAYSACAITIACGSPPDGDIGVPYSHTFPASGAVNLFFAITAGALPPGLSLDPATGVVSGIPTTDGNYSFTITATAGQILATGDDGSFTDSKIIIASNDGVAWTQQTTDITDSGWSIIYAASLSLWINGTDFAGTTDQIQTSPDGTAGSWTAQSSPANGRWVKKLAAGNGIIVALYQVGSMGIMTSTDGVTWTAQTLPGTVSGISSEADVCYSPDLNLFVVADAFPTTTGPGGQVGGVLTSPDGVTWTLQYKQSNLPTRTIAWGNGLFVLMGGPQGSGEHLYTSPDGITWTRHLTDPGGSPMSWASVYYGNGWFVAVSDDTSTNPGNQAATSTDGVSWTLHATPGSSKAWSCVTFGYGMWIAGDGGFNNTQPLMTSIDDGVTWTLVPALGFSFGFMNSIAFGLAPSCSSSVGCSIGIGGATAGNVWAGGSGQGAGNHW